MASRRNRGLRDDDEYVPRTQAEREAGEINAAMARAREWQPEEYEYPDGAPHNFLPFRTAYKLVDVERLGHATADEVARVYRVPRYIPKKQKRYMYYHVHGADTWMIDIVFIKTDGTAWDLSDRDAGVLAEAEIIREEGGYEEEGDAPEPPPPQAAEEEGEGEVGEGEGEGEEGEGEGEGEEGEEDANEIDPEEAERQRLFIREAERILAENKCIKVLLCIHCNSRFVQAFVIPDQTAITLSMFIKYLCDNYYCDTIISDAQGSIAKAIRLLNRYVIRNGIKHIKLNMSEGNNKYFHTMLSLVDRMCRTLRDMIYNVKFNNPVLVVNNGLLYRLCDIYNHVQHDRLSSVMGFPITPDQMFHNRAVQDEFVRRLSAHNYRIRDWNRTLPIHDIVRVRNVVKPFKKRRNTVEDDEYRILGYDGRYLLENLNTGDRGRYLRSQIVRY